VLENELEHKDSMGNGSIIRQGEVQRMSAGTGITHSEFNPGRTESTHFLQIWIIPDRQGHTPGYEQKAFPDSELRNRLCCVASPDGRDGSLSLHQDACMYLGRLHHGDVVFTLAAGRCGYVHLARGKMSLNGQSMTGGDGAYIDAPDELKVTNIENAEVLLFDLPLKPVQ